MIIPNAAILANPITNYTRAEFRRVELPVGVSYDSDPAVARQAVLEAVKLVPGFVGEPEPMAVFWIDMSKTNPFVAKDAALEFIKAALEKKGIEIPFPITTVYMQSES